MYNAMDVSGLHRIGVVENVNGAVMYARAHTHTGFIEIKTYNGRK